MTVARDQYTGVVVCRLEVEAKQWRREMRRLDRDQKQAEEAARIAEEARVAQEEEDERQRLEEEERLRAEEEEAAKAEEGEKGEEAGAGEGGDAPAGEDEGEAEEAPVSKQFSLLMLVLNIELLSLGGVEQ